MISATYILDDDKRKEVATTEKVYNIKIIKEFKINLMGGN